MAESTELKEGDLNNFKEGTDSKTVEKEAINAEKSENDANSTAASIAFDIDEEIANIQAEAVMAAANVVKNNVDISTGEIKQNNLEIEAALNSSIGRGNQEATSSSMPDRASLSQCQLAAYFAEKTAEDARLVIGMGQDLMDAISTTIDVLKSRIGVFAAKAVEASGRGTERGFSVADFYTTMVSKHEAAVAALERRFLNVEIVLKRVQDCADGCMKYAGLAEEITDETLDESIHTKFAACWWNNKGQAAISVALKRERVALLMMRRIWLTVRDDMEDEELNLNRPVEESDEETQQCQNRERKTRIGHIVSTLLGLALISITSLFEVGSDSFNAILVLGLLTTGWCVVYWSIKLYKYLKGNNREERIRTERPEEDEFIENCERRLAIVDAYIRKYNVKINPEAESDTASSSGTATVTDFSQ